MKKVAFIILILGLALPAIGQNEAKSGAWYMYFGNLRFKDSPWAIHGETQHRNFNKLGDLDQLLLRTGLQYNSKSGQSSFLAGYASITNGKEGDSKALFHENRLYQEVVLRQKSGKSALLHRYRYEQRWIENQNFRTRFRYALFFNIPLNSKNLNEKGSSYLQFYDEIFINGENSGGKIQFFDRNRFYAGFGYRLQSGLAVQFGFMEQTTSTVSRGQIQVGIHQQLFSR
jgi:hypothetical protein